MLIVHPSSNCDICLDPYSWETPDQTPHAIACGHVFCKTCLGSVSPTNCPFCRGRFDPTRVKKLHVHQCESAAEEEINLLKKLVVEFKSRDDDLVAITTEVDDWLETRDEESFVHLRKAREAVASYQRAKQRERREKRHIDRLQKQLEELEKTTQAEASVMRETVENFRTQISDLEDKLSERDAEISQLRQELDRYSLGSSTRTANPLPAPPEPVSLDHLPSLYQALLGGSSSFSPALAHNLNGHSPSSTHPLQTITNGSGSSKELYLGGYVPHPHVNGENSGATSATAHHQTPSRRDKGKGKERHPRVSDFYGPPTPDVRERVNGGIVPGASPSNWVIPTTSTYTMPAISSAQPQVVLGYSNELSSSSRPLDPLVDGDPYSLMSAYALEYAHGYGEGYRAAVGLTTPQPNPLTPPLTAQASQSDTIISSPNGYANHAVVQNGHSLLNTLPLYQPQSQALAQFPLTRDTGASDSLYNLQQSMSNLSLSSTAPASSAGSSHRSNMSGLTTNSSSIYSSQPPSSSSRRNRTERSNGRTTAPIPTAVAAPTPTRPAYVHAATTPAPVPRTSRPQTSAENRRDSTLSWGTIDAAQSNQGGDVSRRESLLSWGTVSRGTLTELGLRGFEQGIPNLSDFDLASSYSYHEPADTRTPRNSDLASSSSITASITSSVSSRRGQYPPTPSMQILAGSHGTQNTQVITEPEPQTQTQTRSQESRERREGERVHRSRRTSRHRTHRALTSSAFTNPIVEYDNLPATAPVVSTSGSNYTYDPPMSAGNALGLDLNAGTPRMSEIVAPTPRFSAQPLLRSFSTSDRS